MKNENNAIKNFTRGGQITLHNMRMFMQVSHKVTVLIGIIFLSITLSMSWLTITPYERYVSEAYIYSTLVPFFNKNAKRKFILPNGQVALVTYTNINQSQLAADTKESVINKIVCAAVVGAAIALLIFILVAYGLRKRGRSQSKETLIKGDQLLPKEVVKKMIIKNDEQSDLILAGLPLLKDKETRHFFFHGTTGTGKSTAIKELLDQIRARGDRVILYDMSCQFLEEFYRPKQDILLNPMDARGESWHLWNECRDSADYHSLANALIPTASSSQDPFWVNASRTIFAATAFEMRKDPDRHVLKLLRCLLTSDLDYMERYLKGTEAETLASRKTQKTAVTIRSVLATYLKSMIYIRDEDSPFSIRRWVKRDDEKNWLFISSVDDRHDTLRPLITAWLDIAINTMMSLSVNYSRRIWLILDELTSLQKLPYLRKTLSKVRKFGGCVVIGVQNFCEIEEEYGTKGAHSISSLLNTRIFFREPDPAMAKWSAENFGEMIIEEIQEGISYGASSMRDGVSIQRIEKRKPVVSFSEMMALDDLNAYIRLPGQLPITHLEFQYKEREMLNQGVLPRKIDLEQLREVNDLIETCIMEGQPLLEEERRKNKKNKKIKKKIKASSNQTLDKENIQPSKKTKSVSEKIYEL